MSTLANTAAHFVAIPVRYAVGRWYNIPTNTILAFNAAYIGLHTLDITIAAYCKVDKWKLTHHQKVTLAFVNRTCLMLAAVYITSKLTDSMPLECAVITNLAAITSGFALVTLAKWGKGKNE